MQLNILILHKHHLQKHKIQDCFYGAKHAIYKLATHTLSPILRKG